SATENRPLTCPAKQRATKPLSQDESQRAGHRHDEDREQLVAYELPPGEPVEDELAVLSKGRLVPVEKPPANELCLVQALRLFSHVLLCVGFAGGHGRCQRHGSCATPGAGSPGGAALGVG